MDMKTKVPSTGKTEAHRLQVVEAIAKMDRLEVEFEHNSQMVEKLRAELKAWEHSLGATKVDLNRAIDGYWNLETMTPVEFADNMVSAEIHAKVTGSVGCTYNDVKWER